MHAASVYRVQREAGRDVVTDDALEPFVAPTPADDMDINFAPSVTNAVQGVGYTAVLPKVSRSLPRPAALCLHRSLPSRPLRLQLRCIARYVRSSPQRCQEWLSESARCGLGDKPLMLLLDVVTRWSSTFLLIGRFIACRPAVDRFVKLHDDLKTSRLPKTSGRLSR